MSCDVWWRIGSKISESLGENIRFKNNIQPVVVDVENGQLPEFNLALEICLTMQYHRNWIVGVRAAV